MSALGLRFPDSGGIADIPDRPLRAKSCREQMQQTNSLFDHLVGAGEQRVRYCKAERLGGLQINNQLELG
jgi:hypothetical protein